MKKRTFRRAFLTSLPVMAGYLVLGMGFGILMADKGYPWWWALLMCVTMYAGSMQYVGVNLLAGGVSLASAALMTLMVQARHLFYGVSMVEKYRDMGKLKPYLAFSLTDETYSLVCQADIPQDIDRKGFYFWLSFLNQCYWIVGGTLGAILGNALTFDSRGVDFSMTALFVVIFVEQWEKSKSHLPALFGAGISLACLLVFGPEDFLIPAMVFISLGLFALKPTMERGNRL